MSRTHTRGNVIVEDIKIGDIHYEYDYGCGIKCEVISLPKRNDDNQWEWNSKNLNSAEEIYYLVDPEYYHYSSKLYDYDAYQVDRYI